MRACKDCRAKLGTDRCGFRCLDCYAIHTRLLKMAGDERRKKERVK